MGLFVGYKEFAVIYKKAIDGDVKARNEVVMHYLDKALQMAQECDPEAEAGDVILVLANYIDKNKPSPITFRASYARVIRDRFNKEKKQDIFKNCQRESIDNEMIETMTEDTSDEELRKENKEKVERLLGKLPLRTKNIIESGYGIKGKIKTQKEIGKEQNLCSSRINRIMQEGIALMHERSRESEKSK